MSSNERLARLENAFVSLEQLVENMDGRLGQQMDWINQLGIAQANADSRIAVLAKTQANAGVAIAALAESQANADARIAALADAQIRTEDALKRLADAQAHTDKRLDALIDFVRDSRNGGS